MKLILTRLLEDEFVIDEKPLEVDERPVVDHGSGPVEVADDKEDLLSLVTELLKQHGKLSDLTHELQARQDRVDELEPFMVKLLPFLDSFERVLLLARNHPQWDKTKLANP